MPLFEGSSLGFLAHQNPFVSEKLSEWYHLIQGLLPSPNFYVQILKMPFYKVHGILMKVYWSSLPFPPSVDHVFFKTLHYDPFILGSPACRAWLIALLSYTIPFATTRQ